MGTMSPSMLRGADSPRLRKRRRSRLERRAEISSFFKFPLAWRYKEV